MKLLLDQNLSRNLVGRLTGAYPGTTHVALVGLATASDRQVWSGRRRRPDLAEVFREATGSTPCPPPAPMRR